MEKNLNLSSTRGYFAALVVLLLLIGAVGMFVLRGGLPVGLGVLFLLVAAFMLPGFMVLNPNESAVLILFGDYHGTVRSNGFFWVNPFYVKRKISLRARNLDSTPIKVNDKLGNPILIGVVLVWRVRNTYQAAFDVDDYHHFVDVQSEAAMRTLASAYPYDSFDDEDAELSLRRGGEEIDLLLENMLSERLAIAGIEVIESRISYLAYASEIAGAMLQRQQATAIVAARMRIVEGAVGMVEMALSELESKSIVRLNDDQRATLVSNLMVVLCSDKGTTPVVNTGAAADMNSQRR